jgi:hypothetical protein
MNMYDPKISDTVQYYSLRLFNMWRESPNMPLFMDCTIHLQWNADTSRYDCFYYIVDCEASVMFWMHEFSAKDMLAGLSSWTTFKHLGALSFRSL